MLLILKQSVKKLPLVDEIIDVNARKKITAEQIES